MEKLDLREAISSQLVRILEETAFMLVEQIDAPLPEPTPAIEAVLSFSGLSQGTCWLAVSEAGAGHLANEMLGTDLAVDSNQCEHAVAELLNILTAWILDTWWGNEVAHDMGTPRTERKPIDETVVWRVPAEQRVVITTDAGHTFICAITLES